MMHNKIKKYIHNLMKGYKVFDKQLELEIVSACCDEYDMQLENGISSDDAYNIAIADVESTLKETCSPKNKFTFSLIICCCAFIVSIIEMIIPKLSSQELDVYGFEMPLCILILFGLLIFIIVKWREFHWFDYVILLIFLLSWISTLFQVGTYAYHVQMPDTYWSASYSFPFIIKIRTYVTESPGAIYKLVNTKNTYSFNFIISIISLIIFSIFYIKEKKKIKLKESK